MRILVVDDEKDILELLSYNLGREGFEVRTAPDGEEAIEIAKREPIDLIVLDLMLPGIQGIDLCRMFKSGNRTSMIPIIMLTAKGGEVDRVLGLEMGADDYVTKPFSVREVIARIKAVLRRSRREEEKVEKLAIGDLELNGRSYEIRKRGVPIDLSATEFRLLFYLVRKKGRVFSRETLLDAVWGTDAFVEPRTIDVHIRRIRQQIEDEPSQPRYIKTRRGVGYYVDGDT